MNLYDVLGVAAGVSSAELRAAHRRAVRGLHPDSRDPGLPARDADAALRLVNEAWAVLGDPARRAAYDDGLESGLGRVDESGWLEPTTHVTRGFPWWTVVLAVLLVIFVFTAYAGGSSEPSLR